MFRTPPKIYADMEMEGFYWQEGKKDLDPYIFFSNITKAVRLGHLISGS
jgi:hypothetical protein